MKSKYQQTRHQQGVTLVEYGLLIALISLSVVATVTAVGVQIDNNFLKICKILNHGESCDVND